MVAWDGIRRDTDSRRFRIKLEGNVTPYEYGSLREMSIFKRRAGGQRDVLPSEHFIVALMPVVAYILVRDRRLPRLELVGVVFVGSQFPDLIDKPLAHQVGLLPSGRVFMHSVPFAVPVVVLVAIYGWTTDRMRVSTAFGFAWLSHLLADNYGALRGPNPHIPPDLLWPFVQPVARPVEPHWAGPGGIHTVLWTLFAVVVLSIVGYLVLVDVRAHFVS